MKIALINPSVKGSLKKENLGLANLAAALEADGHTTRIIDEIAGQKVDAGLDEFRPDLVGISFMTMYALRAYELAQQIKRERGLTVVLGGAHPTALPEEAIEFADCVVRGAAENTFPQVVTPTSVRTAGPSPAAAATCRISVPAPVKVRLVTAF